MLSARRNYGVFSLAIFLQQHYFVVAHRLTDALAGICSTEFGLLDFIRSLYP
jgi:hypothetical protein